MLEATAALVLVGALLAVTAQLALLVNDGRRAVGDRRAALREAANQLERLSAWPFAELTTDRVSEIQLSPAAASILPGADLSIDVLDIDGDVATRRLVVRVDWSGPTPEMAKQVTLVGFRFAEDGGRRP